MWICRLDQTRAPPPLGSRVALDLLFKEGSSAHALHNNLPFATKQTNKQERWRPSSSRPFRPYSRRRRDHRPALAHSHLINDEARTRPPPPPRCLPERARRRLPPREYMVARVCVCMPPTPVSHTGSITIKHANRRRACPPRLRPPHFTVAGACSCSFMGRMPTSPPPATASRGCR